MGGSEIRELPWIEGDAVALRCACCGGAPQLFEYVRYAGAMKAVNCERRVLFQENDAYLGDVACSLYLPASSLEFEHETRREAIEFWNKYQCRLMELRGEAAPKDDAA